MRLRSVWAGHSGLMQRSAASPSRCTAFAPQLGQVSGSWKGRAPSAAWAVTATTSGMMSPALRTRMVSPTQTPSWSMKSWLWRMARLTVVPASCTGSKTAVGVSTPVRPTVTSTRRRVVGFSSGGYLKAMAHRGNLLVLPSCSRWAKSSTLTTAPSISKVSSPRLRPMASISPMAASMSVKAL